MQRRGINASLHASILILGSLNLYQGYKRYSQSTRKIEQLRKQPIQSISQKELNQMQGIGKKIAILKLHCTKAPQIKYQSNVGSIQILREQYPIIKNISNLAISLENHLPLFFWESKELTQVLVLPPTSQRNIFQIHHDYVPIQRGFLSSILFWTGTTLALFGDILVNCLILNTHPTFFRGPTEGILTSTFRLIRDCPLIVECEIENGTVIPKVIGLTKEDVLSFYEVDQFEAVIRMGVTAICLYAWRNKIKDNILMPIWKLIKCMFIEKPVQIKKSLKNLLRADVQNELQCIICMHRCRNVIFQNCMHFSICDHCRTEYGGQEVNKCPLCRKETNQRYIFVQNYEQNGK